MRKNKVKREYLNNIHDVLRVIQQHPDKSEHQRIRRIVDLLMQVAATPKGAENAPHELAEDWLDVLLDKYKWSVAARTDDNGRLGMGFIARWQDEPDEDVARWEGNAIRLLTEIDPRLLRICAGKSGKCKGLFYATRPNNNTCSRACISKRYDDDPVKHEARLERQRANDKLEKRRQKKAESGTRLPGGSALNRRKKPKTKEGAWIQDKGGLAAHARVR